MTGRRVRVSGTITVPGDKSISHRAVMFAAIADGVSRIRGFLSAEDTQRSVAMVRALGAEVHEDSPSDLRVTGTGPGGLSEPADVIDAGNSGTTIRIGSGLLAAQPFFSVVTGDRYLRRRPMGRIVKPLSEMGAVISGRAGDSLPPLAIRGGGLRGIRYAMPVASAQVKSALLLAGLFADSPVTVVEPLPSRDHTERMLAAMGAGLSRDGAAITVSPARTLSPLSFTVPGDISSAAFFLVLAACVPGSRLRVDGVGINPRRTGIVDVLRRMGAAVEILSPREEGGEPVADLEVHGKGLKGTEIAPAEVPGLIDEVPVLAVAAAFAEGRSEVRGAGELRVKESDRIAATVRELSALGVMCGELPDGLWVDGPSKIAPGVRCDSHGDHRIAMSLAILSAASGVPVAIGDTACIATSFPEFQDLLDGVVS